MNISDNYREKPCCRRRRKTKSDLAENPTLKISQGVQTGVLELDVSSGNLPLPQQLTEKLRLQQIQK